MGNYLADRRNELGYTQKEIADMVGVTEATVSRWESGAIANMRRDRIKRLADALHTTPNFIMTGESESEDGAPDKTAPATPDEIKAAFWGGDKDLSEDDLDAMWADVKKFADFVAQQKKQEKQNND